MPRTAEPTASASPVLADIEAARLVVVATVDDPEMGGRLARALLAGGVRCVEITLRTPRASAAIKAASREAGMIVGAGTVLNRDDVDRSVEAGAQFLVSPGLSDEVMERAADFDIPAIPGIGTATELQRAHGGGLRHVKVFPASMLGGLPFVRALAAPFPKVRFMPSGGVRHEDVAAYSAEPSVFAVAGGWIASPELIAAGDWTTITQRASRAIAETAR